MFPAVGWRSSCFLTESNQFFSTWWIGQRYRIFHILITRLFWTRCQCPLIWVYVLRCGVMGNVSGGMWWGGGGRVSACFTEYYGGAFGAVFSRSVGVRWSWPMRIGGRGCCWLHFCCWPFLRANCLRGRHSLVSQKKLDQYDWKRQLTRAIHGENPGSPFNENPLKRPSTTRIFLWNSIATQPNLI